VQYLVLGAKARALLKGRAHVQCEDIQALAYPVLRHRILTNFTAASEGVTADKVVKRLIRETPSHESELTKDERFKKMFAS
jgi:MoxR-like ATPase